MSQHYEKNFMERIAQEYKAMEHPSVRKLAELYGISKDTVHRILTEQGVYMGRGKGKTSDFNQAFDSFIINIKNLVLEGKLSPEQANKRYTDYVRQMERRENSDVYQIEGSMSAMRTTNEAEFVDNARWHEASDLDGNAMYWPNQNLLNTRRGHKSGRSKWGLKDLMVLPPNENRQSAEETIAEEWKGWRPRKSNPKVACARCNSAHEQSSIAKAE